MGSLPFPAKRHSRPRRFTSRFELIAPLALFGVLACGSEALESEGKPVGHGHGGRDGTGSARGGGGGQSGGAAGVPLGTPAEQALALFPPGATLTTIYSSAAQRSATALAFNPSVGGELWVTLRQFPVSAPCTQSDPSGCRALIGEVALVATREPVPTAVLKQDGNAWHFMRRPTSIAFGDNGNLATCAEARTGNYEDEPIDYVGPTLWSSDPEIFGVKPQPGQNGTHLDMLHATPFCMGIAHERDNVYWTFNGKLGALDRYDFKEPHVIGGEDHSDGEVHRYVEGELARTPEVPSHLVVHDESGGVFVADTGHGRVVRLSPGTGEISGPISDNYDALRVAARIEGAELSEFASDGFVRPSGLAIHGGVLLVTDNATSRVHALALSDGAPLRTYDTGLAEGSLSGVAVGPDGRVYLTDLLAGSVYRVDAAP